MVERNNKKSSNSAAKSVAVGALAIGAVIFGVGKAIYDASNKPQGKPKSSVPIKKNEEEKKEAEPAPTEYQLDPNMDIESLMCPITMEIVQEPATTIYGHLYELSAIREWV